jgi:type II secretory pathway pseudopilin PulG
MIVIAVIGILAAVMFPTISGYMDRAKDTRKVNELRQISLAINAFRIDKETYFVQGTGHMGWSQGWANYKDGWSYTKTVAEWLAELWYIKQDISHFTTYSTNTNPIISNVSPCVAAGHSADLYMYYTDGADRYSLSAYLKYPSDVSILFIQQAYNGTGSNGICTRYGRNYAIGN